VVEHELKDREVEVVEYVKEDHGSEEEVQEDEDNEKEDEMGLLVHDDLDDHMDGVFPFCRNGQKVKRKASWMDVAFQDALEGRDRMA